MTQTIPSKSWRDALNFLLVEDDDAHAQLVSLQFEQYGENHTLTRVRDGAEALAYLDRAAPFEDATKIDLVLLDLNLPGIDGHDVLDRIKRHDRHATLPVVILTTSNAPRDRFEAYKRHANSYLCKPMNFDAFGKMIQSLVNYWGGLNQPPSSSTAVC